MESEYSKLVHIRNDLVDGVSNWTWPIADNGAWDGPVNDWETSHKTKYFEDVKGFKVAIQAGGCMGMYPRLLADRFESVYTFEPNALNFYCLVQNCQLPNIYKMQAALGDLPDFVESKVNHPNNLGMNTVEYGGKIPQIRLDDLGFEACDLICLDVEGYEEQILSGASNLIARFRPVIILENGQRINIQQHLESIGYKLKEMSKEDGIFIPINN